MEGKIFINDIIGEDTKLVDVIRQVKNQPLATSFLVKIHSEGGFVDSGFEIYDYLKNLDKEKPVTTSTTMAYSIASVVFMAGSTRLMPNNANQVYMIHLPWINAIGDTIQLNEYLNELKDAENRLINFYTEALLIDKGTIHSLLKNETFLSAEECLDFGIATALELPLKAVAKLHTPKENNDSIMNKLTKKIDQIWNKLNGIKAELILQDATGLELVFPELEASDVPSVDAKVNVDDEPAQGEFIMPDGSTVVVSKGVVTEIKPAEDTQPTEDAPDDTDQTAAKAELIKEIMKWEIDVINTSFEVGETLKYVYEEIEYSVSAGEYELSSGKRVITDADGKIIEVKEAEASQPAEPSTDDTEASNNVTEEQVTLLVNALEKSLEKQAELENKYKALAKSIGSDFTTTTSENKPTIAAKDGETKSFSIKRK